MQKKLTIRLNEDDYIKLKIQTEKLKISQVQLIRELIRKNIFDDIKECNIWLNEIRKSTRNLNNNINQIAKKVNSNIFINEIEEIQKLQGELKKVWQLLK